MTRSSYSFIHAADLHIDSALQGLESYQEAPVQEIRGASRAAFERLVRFAIDQDVAFVILAGDIFDGDWKDFHTGLWFSARLRELTRAGIAVYLLSGNHDADAKMTRKLELPEGVHRFSTSKPQTFVDGATGAVLHGQGFAKAATFDNLAQNYPPAVAGSLNIGVLHTNLSNNKNHAPYAPATPDDLRAKGYDYWALGHVHQREVVSEDPYIVFPGNLQARHARETGEKGATVVEVVDGRIESVEHESFDLVRFRTIPVDISEAQTERDGLRAVIEAMDQALEDADGRLLALRVVLEGRSAAHPLLRRNLDGFRASCRDAAIARDRIWLEKLVLNSSALIGDDGSEIRSSLELDDAALKTEVLQAFRSDLDGLLAKIPPQLAQLDDAAIEGGMTMNDEAFLEQLFREAQDELVLRLTEADADKRAGGES